MPGKGVTKISIRPGFSRQLAAYLLAIHGLAFGLAALLPLPWVYKIPLTLLVLYSLIHYWRSELLQRGARIVTAFEWRGEGEWLLWDMQQNPLAATLAGSTFVHPRLIILHFRTVAGKRRSLCLPADRVDGEQLRRLRARLCSLRSGYSKGL
jgi:hypothetical protein